MHNNSNTKDSSIILKKKKFHEILLTKFETLPRSEFTYNTYRCRRRQVHAEYYPKVEARNFAIKKGN